MADTYEEEEDIWQNLQEDRTASDPKANSRVFNRATGSDWTLWRNWPLLK
jgi:hypothetical protein